MPLLCIADIAHGSPDMPPPFIISMRVSVRRASLYILRGRFFICPKDSLMLFSAGANTSSPSFGWRCSAYSSETDMVGHVPLKSGGLSSLL